MGGDCAIGGATTADAAEYVHGDPGDALDAPISVLTDARDAAVLKVTLPFLTSDDLARFILSIRSDRFSALSKLLDLFIFA